MTSFDLRDIKDRTVTFVCTKAPDNSYRFLTKMALLGFPEDNH